LGQIIKDTTLQLPVCVNADLNGLCQKA